MSYPSNRAACLGFSGPDDRVVSVSVPVAKEDGHNSPYYTFDIEYDSTQSTMLTIRLLALNQDGFVQTALQSASFSVGALADLVTRRKATEQEVAGWQSLADDD